MANSVLDGIVVTPHGIDSIWYIPQGLYTMLLKGADWQDSVPWLMPGWGGTSVLLTMPILWWIVEARGRLALVTGITAALVILPDLAHGNPGFAQVGYRFIVDALPLLWILLAIAFRDGLTRAAGAALAFGSFVDHLDVQRGVARLPGVTVRVPGRPPATTGTDRANRATARRRTARTDRLSSDHMMAWPLSSDQQVAWPISWPSRR